MASTFDLQKPDVYDKDISALVRIDHTLKQPGGLNDLLSSLEVFIELNSSLDGRFNNPVRRSRLS